MSRGRKIALIVGGSLLGLILLVGIAIFVTVQTDWFRNFVKNKIIATVEESTGGRVELGSFNFTWSHLRADINNFVIHGLEPAGAGALAPRQTRPGRSQAPVAIERLHRSRLSPRRHSAGQI